MTRIFTPLAFLSTVVLLVSLWLGWRIGDAHLHDAAVQSRVATHFLTAVGALVFAVLVHALVLTYFMGTGRWLEETCNAYHLGNDWQVRNRELKWKLYPGMMFSILLLIATGAFGGAADPASALGFQGWGPLSAAEIHMLVAVVTLVVNATVNAWEFVALRRNGELISAVLEQVRRMRVERGLEV